MQYLNKYIIADSKANSGIIIYFIILLVIAMTWTNRNFVEPNRILRIMFTIAFVTPMLKYHYLTPAVFTIFYTLRLFSVAPFGYLPTNPNFYITISFLVFLLHLVKEDATIKINNLAIVILLITIFSNLINYSNDYDFIKYLICFIFLTVIITDKESVLFIEYSFIALTFCLSIYGLIFYKDFITNTMVYHSERTYWNDPNYLGCVLAIGIIISLHHFIRPHKTKLIRSSYFITIVLGLAILGLIASRGALVSVIIPMSYIIYKNFRSTGTFFLILLLLIVFSFLVSNFVFFEPLKERFLNEDFYSGSGRIRIWRESFKLFYHSPINEIIFGGGAGNSHYLCGKISHSIGASSHNNFLEVLYDFGLIGLVSFVALLIFWFRQNHNRNELAVALIMMFVLTSITLVPLMYLSFWFLLVLIDRQEIKNGTDL